MAEASPPPAPDPENAAAKGPEKHIIWQGSHKVTPKPGDEVHIHYVGTLENGEVFDSSRDREIIFTTKIGVGRVIKAWDMLVPTMNLGEVAKLTCPPSFAYGAGGFPGLIPPYSILIFVVELLGINDERVKSEWTAAGRPGLAK
ncbi:hypothetical protein L211DRAFT_847782 [Terfezia boudieri ATCC MYA-4762]|uniref:peptidylprolyl isomerase n=1 Tax=Terfezia boudieri ATCC MYA-4762 TaxID=1051890 RepID=A0A3N4LTB0_9PEZI|nr:hypothetical protein L211DRAFT_847782 [Terfezia boudieri ATCC MYA-4762]